MIGFRTIYTQDPLPTGAACFLYDRDGDIVLVIHEPSLLDDPRAVMDEVSRHCHENVVGHLPQLSISLAS